MLKKLKKILCALFIYTFVLNFIPQAHVFAQSQQIGNMERQCKATKEGTETDRLTKKMCREYFDEISLAGASGASAGAAASSGMGAGATAAIIMGIAAVGGVVAAIADGGGGGSSSAVSHH